ncbi:MAG: NfeD family protein [Actinomycetes bacterium]|jgi:membrane protein implicated in regulation of membrane protease activity
MHAWTWFAIAGICAVLEILNLSLVFASFAIGALFAAFERLISPNVPAQWIVFALATVLTLRLKPILTRYIFRKTPASDTGIQALIGQKAVATSQISDSTGTISLKNETWTARSTGGTIEIGQNVTVTGIDGAVAHVTLRS